MTADAMNGAVQALRAFDDPALVAALSARVQRIAPSAAPASVAREIVEVAFIAGALTDPAAVHELLREACFRIGRVLAGLPNTEGEAPLAWFAARAFFPARRYVLRRLAQAAERNPTLWPRFFEMIAFDSAGSFTPHAGAFAKAPQYCEELAIAGAALTPAARRDFWLAHASQVTGFRLVHGTLLLHANDVPPGVRLALTPQARQEAARQFARPMLWWWVECGWPPEQERRPGVLSERVPGFVRDMLNRGEAQVVLSSGHEISFGGPGFAESLLALAKLLGCAPTRVCYVAQNPVVPAQYRRQATLPASARPVVCTGNTHLLLPMTQDAAATEIRRSHRYVCLNNIPHIFRAALLLHAMRDGLLDKGLFSFNWKLATDLPPGSIPATPARLRPYFPDTSADEIARLIASAEPMLPRRLDLGDTKLDSHGRGAHVQQFAADLTSDAYFYVVTESDMEEPDKTTRFTEKLVKPLASCNPFIVFGNAGVLASLRSLGFETFGDVLDESYDTIANPAHRFLAAYRTFRRICDMSLEEHEALYARLLPRLLHNRERMKQLPQAFVAGILDAIESAESAWQA